MIQSPFPLSHAHITQPLSNHLVIIHTMVVSGQSVTGRITLSVDGIPIQPSYIQGV